MSFIKINHNLFDGAKQTSSALNLTGFQNRSGFFAELGNELFLQKQESTDLWNQRDPHLIF